jgi:hypothetical protein
MPLTVSGFATRPTGHSERATNLPYACRFCFVGRAAADTGSAPAHVHSPNSVLSLVRLAFELTAAGSAAGLGIGCFGKDAISGFADWLASESLLTSCFPKRHLISRPPPSPTSLFLTFKALYPSSYYESLSSFKMPDHRRKPVPEHEWAEHKPRIMRFIRDDRKQIKNLPELMKEYGLDARYVVSTRLR